jgi:hypothetical protein
LLQPELKLQLYRLQSPVAILLTHKYIVSMVNSTMARRISTVVALAWAVVRVCIALSILIVQLLYVEATVDVRRQLWQPKKPCRQKFTVKMASLTTMKLISTVVVSAKAARLIVIALSILIAKAEFVEMAVDAVQENQGANRMLLVCCQLTQVCW